VLLTGCSATGDRKDVAGKPRKTRTKEERLNMKTTVLRIKNSARPLLPPLSLHEIVNSEIKMMKLISLFGFNSETALDYTEGWYAGAAARMERALQPELAKRMYRKTSEVLGNKSPTISAKPDGAWAGSQLSILKGERSGLLTRIAAMASGSLCTRMKS